MSAIGEDLSASGYEGASRVSLCMRARDGPVRGKGEMS